MKIQFVQPYIPYKPGDIRDTETIAAIGLIQMHIAEEYQEPPEVSPQQVTRPKSAKRTATLKKPSRKR